MKRREAKAAGLKYFRSSSCLRGHDNLRYTSDGKCVQCAKDRIAEFRQTDKYKDYQREYQARYRNDPDNKARLDAIQERYRMKRRNAKQD